MIVAYFGIRIPSTNNLQNTTYAGYTAQTQDILMDYGAKVIQIVIKFQSSKMASAAILDFEIRDFCTAVLLGMSWRLNLSSSTRPTPR